MRDKRRYKRFTLNDFKVSGKMIPAAEMKVVNISIKGISLKVSRRLNISGEYSLTLEGKTSVSLRGIVVWCSLIETRKGSLEEMIPIYSAGMQFKDMSNEETTKLLNFILIRKLETSWKQAGSKPETTADKFADEDIPVIATEFIDIGIESLDLIEKDRETLASIADQSTVKNSGKKADAPQNKTVD